MSAPVFPRNIQDWFPLGWTGWISLQSKGLSGVLSKIRVQQVQFFGLQFLYVQLSHPYMSTGETIALTGWTFLAKVTHLPFHTLSWLVIAFLPRNKHLLISWLKSLSTVISKPTKMTSVTVSIVSPSSCHDVMELDATIFVA